jgi:4-carboxymuconolactone decarboxylase
MASLPDATKGLTGEAHEIMVDIMARRKFDRTEQLGPYRFLLNDPILTKYIERLGYYYKYEGTLPRDVFQFLVLGFAKQADIEFIWRDHIEPAREAGLPDRVIDDLKSGKTDLGPPYQGVRELMGYCHRYQSIPKALQDQIIADFGVDGLLELVTLCGFYTMIGMINNCFDVPMPNVSPG